MATNDDTVQYQFHVDRETWTEWKRTIPREKSLRDRIIELIEADTEGKFDEELIADGGDGIGAALAELEDDDPYAEINQMAIELVRQADERLKANQIQAAVAEKLEITSESWWERHGRPALKEAGAESRRGAGWIIKVSDDD